MTAETFVTIAFSGVLMLAFVGLAALLRALERAFPAFSDWLDERWPEPEAWRKW